MKKISHGSVDHSVFSKQNFFLSLILLASIVGLIVFTWIVGSPGTFQKLFSSQKTLEYRFSASGFAPHEVVDTWVTFPATGKSQTLSAAAADAKGNVSFTVLSGVEWPKGGVQLSARGEKSNHESSADYVSASASYSLSAVSNAKGDGERCDAKQGGSYTGFRIGRTDGDGPGGHCVDVSCGQACCNDACQCSGTCGASPDEQAAVAAAAAQARADAAKKAAGPTQQGTPPGVAPDPNTSAGAGDIAWGNCITRGGSVDQCSHEAANAYNDKQHQLVKEAKGDPAKLQALADQDRLNGQETALKSAAACKDASGHPLPHPETQCIDPTGKPVTLTNNQLVAAMNASYKAGCAKDDAGRACAVDVGKKAGILPGQQPPPKTKDVAKTTNPSQVQTQSQTQKDCAGHAAIQGRDGKYYDCKTLKPISYSDAQIAETALVNCNKSAGGYWDKKAQSDCIVAQTTKLKAVVAAQNQLNATQKNIDAEAASNCRENQKSGLLSNGQSFSDCVIVEKAKIKAAAESAVQAADSCYYKTGSDKTKCEVQLLNVSVSQAQIKAESTIAISKSCGQGNVNFSNSSAAISYSSCAAGYQKAVDAGFSVNASGKINDPASGKEVVFDDNKKTWDFKENVDARKAAEDSKALVVSHCSQLSGPSAALCGQTYNQAISEGATIKKDSKGELVAVYTNDKGVKVETKPVIALTPNQQLVNPTKPAIFVESGAKFEAAKKLVEDSLVAEKQKNQATNLVNQHCSQLSGPSAALCGQVYKDFVANGGVVTQTPTGIKATDKHGVVYNPDLIFTKNGQLSDVYKPVTEHGVTTAGSSFFRPTGEVEITDLNKQCNAAAGCDAASYARQWCWDQNSRGQGGKFFKYDANGNQTTSYCGEYQADSSNNPANKGRTSGSDSDHTSNTPDGGYFKTLCNGTDCAKVDQALPQIAQILPKYSGNVTPDVVNYTVYDAPKYVNAGLFFLPGFTPTDMCKKNPYGQFIYTTDMDKATGLPISGNSMGGATGFVAGAVDGIVGKTVGNNVRCGGDGSYKVVADINEYGKEEVVACTAVEKNAKPDQNGKDNPCKDPNFFRNKLGQDASGKNVFVTGAFVRDQATKDGVSVELLKILAGNGDHPSDAGITVLSGIFGAAGANAIGRQNNLPDCTSSDSDECKNFRTNVKKWLDQIGVPYDSKIGSCNISGKDTGNYGTGTWSAAQCGEIPKFISFETNAGERFHRTILNPFQALSPVGSATVTKTDTITGLVGGLAGYGGVGTAASIGFGSQAAGPITLGIYTGDAVGQYINNISARDQLRNVMGIPCNLDGNSAESLTFTCNTSGINITDNGSVDALVDKMKADGGNKFQPFENADLNNPAVVEALKVSQKDCPKPLFLSESPRACLDLHHVAYDDYVKAEALQKEYAKYLLQSGAGGSVVAQQNAKIDEARTNIAMNLIFAALGSPQGEKLLSGVISGIVTPSEETAAAIAARNVAGKASFPTIPGSGYITKFGEFINNGGLLGKGTFETVPVGGAGVGPEIAAAKPEVIAVKPNQGMELRPGDQIKVGATDFGELKPGDVITFKETTPGGSSTTHSIKVEDPLINPNQKIEIPANAKVVVQKPGQVLRPLDEDFVGLQNGGQIVRAKPATPVVVAQTPVEPPKVEPVTPIKSPPTKPANLTAGEAARLEQIPVEARDDVQIALKQLDDLKKSNPNAFGQNLSQEEWYRLSRAKALDVMKKSGVTSAEENVDLVLKDLANDYPGVAGRGNIFEQVFTPAKRGDELLAKLEPKTQQPAVASKPTPAKTGAPKIESKPTVAPTAAPKTEPIKTAPALPAPAKPVESAPPVAAKTTKTATSKQWWEFWKTDEQPIAATKTFSRTRRMTVYDMGRSPDANLLITGDKTVSRLHAEVTVLDDGTVYIADTSSLNGTIVRGQKISSVTKLEIGDSVKLGDTTLKFTGLKNGEPRFVIDQSPSVAANITNVPAERAPLYGAKPVGKSVSAPLASRPSLQTQINDLTAVENDLARGINSPRVKAFWKGLARDTEGRWLKYSPGGVEQAGNYFKFGVQAEADLSNSTILGYVKANVKARKSFLMALDQGNFVGNSKQFEQWLINLQKDAAYKGEAGALRQGYAYSPGHTPIIQDDIQQLAKSYGDPYSLARPNTVNKVALDGIPQEGLPYDLVGKDSVTHFYPDSKYFPDYYQAMQKKLVDIRQGFASGASRKQLIQDISDFYQIAANVRNFEEVNNSLYMNMVNAMLEKAGVNPVEQGILDFAAMRLQPKAFRAYFADEVVRVNPSLAGEVGSNAVKVGPAVQLGSGYVPGSGLQKASDGISEALTNLWRKATGRPTVAVETVVDDASGAVFQYRTVGKTGSSIDSWSLQNGNWVQTPEGWVQVDKNTVIEQAFKGQADQAGLKLPQSETMDFVANTDSTFRFKGAKDVNGNLVDTSWQVKNDVKIAQKVGDNVGVGSFKPYELGANGETLQVNNIAAGNKLNIKAGQQIWDSASGKWVEIKEGMQVGFVEPGQTPAYTSLSGVGERSVSADTRIFLLENRQPVMAEVSLGEVKVGTKVGGNGALPQVVNAPVPVAPKPTLELKPGSKFTGTTTGTAGSNVGIEVGSKDTIEVVGADGVTRTYRMANGETAVILSNDKSIMVGRLTDPSRNLGSAITFEVSSVKPPSLTDNVRSFFNDLRNNILGPRGGVEPTGFVAAPSTTVTEIPAVKSGVEVRVRVGEKVTLRDTEGNLTDVAPTGGMKVREINPDGTRGVAQDVPSNGQFPITSGHSFEVLDSRGIVVAKGQVVEIAGKDVTGEGWTKIDFGKSGAASLDVQSVRVQLADGTVKEVPLTDGMKVTQSSYPNSYPVGERGLSVNLHEGSTATIFDGTNIVAEGKIVSAKGNVRPYVEPQATPLERFQAWWEKTFGGKPTETPVVPAATPSEVTLPIKRQAASGASWTGGEVFNGVPRQMEENVALRLPVTASDSQLETALRQLGYAEDKIAEGVTKARVVQTKIASQVDAIQARIQTDIDASVSKTVARLKSAGITDEAVINQEIERTVQQRIDAWKNPTEFTDGSYSQTLNTARKGLSAPGDARFAPQVESRVNFDGLKTQGINKGRSAMGLTPDASAFGATTPIGETPVVAPTGPQVPAAQPQPVVVTEIKDTRSFLDRLRGIPDPRIGQGRVGILLNTPAETPVVLKSGEYITSVNKQWRQVVEGDVVKISYVDGTTVELKMGIDGIEIPIGKKITGLQLFDGNGGVIDTFELGNLRVEKPGIALKEGSVIYGRDGTAYTLETGDKVYLSDRAGLPIKSYEVGSGEVSVITEDSTSISIIRGDNSPNPKNFLVSAEGKDVLGRVPVDARPIADPRNPLQKLGDWFQERFGGKKVTPVETPAVSTPSNINANQGLGSGFGSNDRGAITVSADGRVQVSVNKPITLEHADGTTLEFTPTNDVKVVEVNAGVKGTPQDLPTTGNLTLSRDVQFVDAKGNVLGEGRITAVDGKKVVEASVVKDNWSSVNFGKNPGVDLEVPTGNQIRIKLADGSVKEVPLTEGTKVTVSGKGPDGSVVTNDFRVTQQGLSMTLPEGTTVTVVDGTNVLAEGNVVGVQGRITSPSRLVNPQPTIPERFQSWWEKTFGGKSTETPVVPAATPSEVTLPIKRQAASGASWTGGEVFNGVPRQMEENVALRLPVTASDSQLETALRQLGYAEDKIAEGVTKARVVQTKIASQVDAIQARIQTDIDASVSKTVARLKSAGITDEAVINQEIERTVQQRIDAWKNPTEFTDGSYSQTLNTARKGLSAPGDARFAPQVESRVNFDGLKAQGINKGRSAMGLTPDASAFGATTPIGETPMVAASKVVNDESILGRIRRILLGSEKKVAEPITLKVGETVKVELPNGERIDVVITPETKVKVGNLDDSTVVPQDFAPDGTMSKVPTDKEVIIYDKNGNPVRGKIVTSSENVKPTAGKKVASDKLDDAGNAAVLTSEEQASQQGGGPVLFYDPWGWYRRYAIPRVIYEILRNTSLPGGMFIDLFWIPPLPSKDSLTTNSLPGTSGLIPSNLIPGKDSKETSTTPVNVIYRYTFPDAIPPVTVTPPNASGKVVASGTQCELVRAFAERYPNAKLTTQPVGYNLCDLAKKWNISADYFLGQMLQESGFNPDAVLGKSTGLLQMESNLGYWPFANMLKSLPDSEAEKTFDLLTGNDSHEVWLSIKAKLALLNKDNKSVEDALNPYLKLKDPLQNMVISTYYLSWTRKYVESKTPELSSDLKMDMAFAMYNKYSLPFDMYAACKADSNGPCATKSASTLTWEDLSLYLEKGSQAWIERVKQNASNQQYGDPEALRAGAVRRTLEYIKNIETYRARMNGVLKNYPNGVDETNYQKFRDELYRSFGYRASTNTSAPTSASGVLGTTFGNETGLSASAKSAVGSNGSQHEAFTWDTYLARFGDKVNELSNATCRPGEYVSVKGGIGAVVCNQNSKFQGQCLPGSTWYSTDSTKVCGSDYLWKNATDSKVIDEGKKKFQEAVPLKDSIARKYQVYLVDRWGFWTADNVRAEDSLLQTVPSEIYKGAIINGLARSNGDSHDSFSAGYDVPGTDDVGIFLTYSPLNENDKNFVQEVTLHELLHRYGEKKKLGGKDPSFNQLLSSSGIKLGNNGYIHETGYSANALDTKYDCSNHNSTELFACMGTEYRFGSSKLKTDFPNIYSYYKNKVYGGKEY